MAASKADIASYVKPELAPIYSYKAEIDTTPTGANRTWANLCAGFDNISEALNEVVQQYFFLCGKGFGVNYVTGAAPAVTMTGVRIVGDTAQDYIFGKKYDLMSNRDSNLRLTRTDEDGTTEIISANITFCNVTEIGGGTTDGSAISVEMRFNGQPYIGDAWSA